MHRPMDLRSGAAAGAGGGRAGCAPADWPLLAAASAIAAEARAVVKVGPQNVHSLPRYPKLCLSSSECDTRLLRAPASAEPLSNVRPQIAGDLPLLSPPRRVREHAGQSCGRWGHISVPTQQLPVPSFFYLSFLQRVGLQVEAGNRSWLGMACNRMASKPAAGPSHKTSHLLLCT